MEEKQQQKSGAYYKESDIYGTTHGLLRDTTDVC